MAEVFLDEELDLDYRFYMSEISRPVALNALQQHAAVMTLLNQNPALGGEFALVQDVNIPETVGYKWESPRYEMYLGAQDNIPDDYDWRDPVPAGEEDIPALEVIFRTREGAEVTVPQFQAAVNAVKSIIQNPVVGMVAGKRRHRKTKKSSRKHRSTRRR